MKKFLAVSLFALSALFVTGVDAPVAEAQYYRWQCTMQNYCYWNYYNQYVCYAREYCCADVYNPYTGAYAWQCYWN
jgi:hypothetical protein